MGFEDLQQKWRDIRGGMDRHDLRPEFKALLNPLDVRVDFGCERSTSARTQTKPRPGSLPLNASSSSNSAVLAGKEAGALFTQRTQGAVVALPALHSTDKVRTT